MEGGSTSQSTRPFDLTGPLPQGVTVLEASAGTGKTYTLAALATRFIAERAVPLDQLLIVTFTRAATSELRERVRERLVLTEQALARAAARGAGAGAGAGAETEAESESDSDSHPDPDSDPEAKAEAVTVDEVAAKLARAPAPILAQRLQRLADAIANFDAITIETTHGFCQNVLDGLGTLAESDPAAIFTDSLEELTREVVDDLYLRRFARQAEGVLIGYEQAQTVASAAIANPLQPLYPLADDGSAAALRRRLAQAVRTELDARKRSQGLMTHDDQLTRLLRTLDGSHGEAAVASLRARFRVVLIDEFQDTDPTQWAIVNRAFAEQTTLVLIGDPKQAIYAFRGADVHAYLAAARSAGVRATLAVNHRSDQLLLDGLDALFGNARLGHPEIVYRRVRATAANAVPRLQGAPGDGALQIRLLEAGETSVRRTAKTGFPESSSARAYIARDLAAEAHRLLGSGAQVLTRERPGAAGSAMVALKPGDVAVLVRTHQQARTVKETLEQVGLPAVINGSGSVFGTPAAQDWLVILRALEDPSQPARARTAALSAAIGWSATELALADEPTFEQLHRLLHGWAQTLREHGVTALVRAVLHRQELVGRLLSVTGGERHLTDLEHIGQLLAADTTVQGAGVTSLASWLQTRIGAADREGTGDERTRRLDSDADAIQVLTFHRSKGLEFPIVFCPFLWEPGRLAKDGEPVYFHADDGRRALDVGLEGPEYQAHLRRHNLEERDEELRLAYVALTRARHRAVVWWASVWQARDSPLGRLLFARDKDGNVAPEGSGRPREQDARARFEQLAASAPHAVSVVAARHHWPPPASVAVSASRQQDPAALQRARFTRTLDTAWRRTSYSALTAQAHAATIAAEQEQEPLSDEPWTQAEPQRSELPLAQMASGPELGTLIHRVLQQLDFAVPDLQASLLELLSNATHRRPELLGCAPEQAATGLALALATPLGGERAGLPLAGVERRDRLDELTFELPLAVTTQPPAAPTLSDLADLMDMLLPGSDPLAGYSARLRDPQLAATLRGYLTGSIDLVLRTREEAGGPERYQVIDYKTNWLAAPGQPLAATDYAPAALAAEMQRAHYVLQALLYSVALHRYLRWRVADYDPVRDLGGVRYLFLRGMTGGHEGVFSWDPPAALILASSDLLAQGGER